MHTSETSFGSKNVTFLGRVILKNNSMLKMINKALNKAYMPLLLKYISLAAFAALVVLGFSASSSDPAFLHQLRNTNLGNLIVWSYWWPAIVVGAIFFGRVWCMVCPVK